MVLFSFLLLLGGDASHPTPFGLVLLLRGASTTHKEEVEGSTITRKREREVRESSTAEREEEGPPLN